MQKAVALFEKNTDHPDPHYPSALSGLGEACFHQGDLKGAETFYEKYCIGLSRFTERMMIGTRQIVICKQ